jgi:hypothetical protein
MIGPPKNAAAVQRWQALKVTRYRFHLAAGCGTCLRRVGFVEITYDPTTGVSTKAFIDWIKQATDDESSWVLTDFAGPRYMMSGECRAQLASC